MIYFNYISNKFQVVSIIAGGIGGCLLLLKSEFNGMNLQVYKKASLISIPKFFFNTFVLIRKKKNLKNSSYHKKFLKYIPLYIKTAIFIYLEDKLVPEEISFRKLIDKLLQVVMTIYFLKYKLKYYDKFIKNHINQVLFGWMGAVIRSLLINLFKIIKYGIKYKII